MIASQSAKTQVLVEPTARRKLQLLDQELHALLLGQTGLIPSTPGRDVQIWPIRDLPPKVGLSTRAGQSRLLHDLASIELQALELCLRTLHEFPQAPREFREQLAGVARDEGRHLDLCLQALDELEIPWGSYPTHLGLWQSVSSEDSLIDRVLIVHRYLEGSGLDASDTILRRLSGVGAREALSAVQVIRHEEVEHVRFGSRWYKQLCLDEKLDVGQDFSQRLHRLFTRIPRRLEPIRSDLRQMVGFSDHEIAELESLRQRWLKKTERIHPPVN